MKFHLGCQLIYSVTQPSTLVFNISPVKNGYQKICQENLKIDPPLDFDEYISSTAENRFFRVNAPAGKLQVSYAATVELSHFYTDPDEIAEIPMADLPLDALDYLYPSRYCQSDKLLRLAQSEFGNLKPGYSRVQAICNWIYDKIAYLPGSTNSQTSAYDTATAREGVCRDFAHLGIAFCRALNIPARFVSGYACQLNPPDFHACFEAYLDVGGGSMRDNRWYIFDPTRLVPRNGFIRIGMGRDAADVAFAMIFGLVQMEEMQIFVESESDLRIDAAGKREAMSTI